VAGLFGRAAAFARSPAGRRAMEKAMQYAKSEKGKQQIAGAREKLAKRRPPGR
jgi:malate synthase